MIHWHGVEAEEAVKILASDAKSGLSFDEAEKRRKKTGSNKLPEEKPLSSIKLFLRQFQSPPIYILLIAGAVTLLFNKLTDAVVIFGAVLLNTVVGYIQEAKAAKALAALKKVVRIKSKVIREGNEMEIDSESLVPGDIIMLEAGDSVPADARLIAAHNLKAHEAVLTGEWLLAEKDESVFPQEISLADRDNMVYMGTLVEEGQGRAIVVATGANTEIGKIASMVREIREEKTPLQKKLSELTRTIGIIVIVLALLVFIGGAVQGRDVVTMFAVAVAVVVAGIPEGLPVAMTVILAIGMQNILKRKGLIRKLVAAETLGSTSVIATDKTLTLTEGRMEIVATVSSDYKITGKNLSEWADNFKKVSHPDHVLLMSGVITASPAFIENPQEPPESWRVRGEPTDKAFISGGGRIGLLKHELDKQFEEIDVLPFDNRRKSAAVLVRKNGEYWFFISGAPEQLIEKSKFIEVRGERQDLDKSVAENLNDKLYDITSQGLRVIGAAYKRITNYEAGTIDLEKEINSLIFLGFIGLRDPLRPEAKEAIAVCRSAGMKPIIITGDHLLTARGIAKELGLDGKNEDCITGSELDLLSDDALDKKLKDLEVYARVEPRHKMRVVEAWQRAGQVVAMTGDGVNDAPALRRADIGIALGSGSDVAKGVADLVLLDDSFNIIVAAVEEGRVILDNIRKVITYLFSGIFTETMLVGGSIIFGLPLPVSAVQILWVNIIEDGLPGIALAFESKEKDVMARPPEDMTRGLLTTRMKTIIILIGALTNLALFGIFLAFLRALGPEKIEYTRTVIFAGLAIYSLFYLFACKNLRKNIWHLNILSNKFLLMGWLFGMLMLVGAVYIPFLQILLSTTPLLARDWILLLSFGLLNLFFIEAIKWYFIKKDGLRAA